MALEAEYSIGDVAELCGVSASTLRAWEARYQVVAPRRTDAAYRTYTAQDVDAIRQMRMLIDSGVPARRAAATVRQRYGEEPAEPSGSDAASSLSDSDALVRAGAKLDARAVQRVLDDAFALASVERVIDDWLMPSLRALGAAWETGAISVAAEHFVTAAVMRRLSALFEASPPSGPAVVVGLPPGARHELPALAFAVCLRRAGVGALYVGADVPLESWATVAHTSGARAAVVSATHPGDLPNAQATVDALRAAGVDLVYVGGRSAADIKSGTLLPDRLSTGAALVADALRLTRSRPTDPQLLES